MIRLTMLPAAITALLRASDADCSSTSGAAGGDTGGAPGSTWVGSASACRPEYTLPG